VRPAERWPLHPVPKEGEALSSWLNRVANCYQMDVHDLLEHDLGDGVVDDLDIAPSISLLTTLAQRSGIEIDQLRCMSFAGWTPWLLDNLDDSVSDALESYVFQLSVLLPKKSRKIRQIARWRAWLPTQPIHRACPRCLQDSADQPILLMWQLPLMLSCPLHGCWLELYCGLPGKSFGWENNLHPLREANKSIVSVDRRTWQALTAGYVDLPRRRIHAGLWFRLLRTMLDELNTPISLCGSHGSTIRYVWERCGHPIRAGQFLWRPYEILPTQAQLQMLEAAATAIHLIESETLRTSGEFAEVFLPEPQTEFTNGLQPDVLKNKSANYWQAAVKALEEVMIEARYDPETARALFRLASYGAHDLFSLEDLRAIFAEAQIPLEFLSLDNPDNPFE
jgi:hypothetical protein